MLTSNLIKAELSHAYLKALAAVSGISVEDVRVDMDSVDAYLAFKGMISPDAALSSPRIEIQLKASSRNQVDSSGELSFVLPIGNYNDLRANSMVPRLLVLLNMPEDDSEWVSHTAEALILRRCAYYLNLKGSPESSNQTSVTVKFPVHNILDPASLKGMMVRAAKQEDL
jgi:hypothetical protein